MYGSSRKIHFVGVGGIGMSGLAEILLNLGYEVSGSDLHGTDITKRLETLGLLFKEGHEAAHVDGAEILVMSAAVPESNPEVAAARTAGIPVLHRSDLLADLMRLKPNAVVVGGTHGKTTTTSMISAFLDLANIGATTVVGGILHRSGTNARWGTGQYIVAEADEHDGSFLRLHPTIAVVTNIDAEHLEYYGSLDRVKRAFADFCNMVPFYGYSILCRDDANTRAILPDIESACLTYGIEEGASIRAEHIRVSGGGDTFGSERFRALRTQFDVVSYDERLGATGKLGTIEIHALGTHNVLNALAACTVGLCLSMRFGLIAEGLKHFDGVRRRMQLVGESHGVVVVEDYAHHPTEIRVTLEAARCTNPNRLIVVFQPHLYSRTKFLSEEFGAVLCEADRALVTAIYPSREEPMPGVDSTLIVDASRNKGCHQVELVESMHDVPGYLAPDLQPGDLVLVLGAGNINQIAAPILDAWRAHHG
ncbi:MAG: UDP-N-acetylmuramate--L-alanine ligase [Candidatus Hydrogenedens sp.]|nr:UDP-N-acetylmuramate--L-alanine ligase [Candidatus Hydrogenedens sp.]